MLQHNNKKYKCFYMGTSEFLINEMMLIVLPQSAEVQLTCFTAQYVVQNWVINYVEICPCPLIRLFFCSLGDFCFKNVDLLKAEIIIWLAEIKTKHQNIKQVTYITAKVSNKTGHCVWGFCVCFVMYYFVSSLVLQSSWRGRESWLLCFYYLTDVLLI